VNALVGAPARMVESIVRYWLFCSVSNSWEDLVLHAAFNRVAEPPMQKAET
jgi:hypothetical protein